MANGGRDMTLADARSANGNDIDGILDEGAAAQPLDLQLQRGTEAVELQGGEGLLAGQA